MIGKSLRKVCNEGSNEKVCKNEYFFGIVMSARKDNMLNSISI